MADGPWYDGAEQRRRRRAAGLSLTELAASAASSLTHLSLIESGKPQQAPRQPSPRVAKRVADALGCTVEDLMLGRPESQDTTQAVGA